MSQDIRIDEPGAGEWVMDRSGGTFNPYGDHCFASYKDGNIIGGFVCAGFFGNCWTLHQAGIDPHWCSRELLWMVFHYIFVQSKCSKAVGLVASNNHKALATNLRGGWVIEALLRDMFAPGVHMFVLTMTKEQCLWLDYEPKHWAPGNKEAA
jgi:hypothetical protein